VKKKFFSPFTHNPCSHIESILKDYIIFCVDSTTSMYEHIHTTTPNMSMIIFYIIYDHVHTYSYIDNDSMFCMVQTRPDVRNQIKKLKKISYEIVKNQNAGIVDVKIRELSHKDTGRALYVATSAFAELSYKHKIIAKIIHKAQEDIKKAIDTSKTKEELIKRISEIVLDPKGEYSSKLYV